MPRHCNKYGVIGLVLFTLAAFLVSHFQEKGDKEQFCDGTLRCLIVTEGFSSSVKRLEVGYNYALLQRFASDIAATDVIIEGFSKSDGIKDSLLNGRFDIAVLPFQDSLVIDSLYLLTAADSTALWVIHESKHSKARVLSDWIGNYAQSPLRDSLARRFLEIIDPYRANGEKGKHISPYDSLFRKEAATIGWDWRLLAALSYQESRFHIEAESHRGAKGLMQMTPRAARHHKVENLFDPEESISAGARHIAELQRKFRGKAASGKELTLFVLAAYNAGSGRITDCINFANSLEMPSRTWAELKAVIPLMNEEATENNEAVKLGSFNGTETISFVDRVMRLYNLFTEYAPSEPDQHSK